ncbi:GNAT family N-acetyltransferase [Oscillatoria sp. FACHB-1407]|uniref:GNAT family N-acetyltransferase n=1 Tax=Oscillatoria sp. FACHB-1407 TaxID=2692847 RepID=UPI001684C83B|nr:GNAT family N-acetyltransferase [Oscillatoria sp. FACHB-1407]MBD2462903.1 GNAT family N-acetyltransferase [Oscillatoria sp. FACHB-1407]
MVHIQPYSHEFQNQLIALILDIQQKEFSIPITLTDQPDLLNIPQVYQQGQGNFWIALDADQVIGTIALLDIGGNQGALRKMFVHKDYRGKHIGCGQQLLNRLLREASLQGITTIYLGTTEFFKAAHRFYEKNGFVEIAQSQLPAHFPLVGVDTKFYQYQVTAPIVGASVAVV